ncbi:hypothetical protein V5799_023803, partial [Amblyomma americanum]
LHLPGAYRLGADTNGLRAAASCQRNAGPWLAPLGHQRGDLLLPDRGRRCGGSCVRAPSYLPTWCTELPPSTVPVRGHQRREAAHRGLQCPNSCLALIHLLEALPSLKPALQYRNLNFPVLCVGWLSRTTHANWTCCFVNQTWRLLTSLMAPQ